jgi:hypothetical protein
MWTENPSTSAHSLVSLIDRDRVLLGDDPLGLFDDDQDSSPAVAR